MNDSQIRQIVQQEMARQSQANRFNLTNTTRHQHTGNDIASINQNDIKPGNSVEGSITFSTATQYNIGVNFNPSMILVHGNVTGASGEKFITVGSAKLGPSYYLQPDTSTSVKVGGTPQTIIQSCTYFGADSGGTLHTLVDEGHIVDIFYSTVKARATIQSFSSQGIILTVDTLSAGWNINLSWTIS